MELGLIPTEALVDELMRRATAFVLAYQYFDGTGGDLDLPVTKSVVEGNLVHCAGLVRVLDSRVDSGLLGVLSAGLEYDTGEPPEEEEEDECE